MCRVDRDGQSAFIGLPEREATKIQDLWSRDEIGLELSVEVHAPVVVGIYPMRIARYITDGAYHPNGQPGTFTGSNGHHPHGSTQSQAASEPMTAPLPHRPATAH